VSKEDLLKVLKDFGLTDTEAEIYLFLARHESLKGTEIARLIKKDKAQVYHILKSLQAKGLVESTLEAPVRFIPVPFERIVESTIKSKKDEAAQIERDKDDLLKYWGSINKNKIDLTTEKFVVIEGRHKVYSKITQMIKETKNQFSIITTVNALVRADQFGLYDAAFKNPLKSKIEFRFLTELSNQNLKVIKEILKKTSKKGINFRGRNPDLGLSLFPRMVIRDKEETVFFLAPRTANPTEENDEMCLWTNSKDITKAFSGVFEDSWHRAININTKILETETGIFSPQTCLIENPEQSKKKYDDTIKSAKKEVFLVTSSKNLVKFYSEISQLKGKAKGLTVKVLAPITNENLQVSLKLSKYCTVRHAPHNYLTTLIIDRKHLFQFRTPLYKTSTEKSNPFENIIYSNKKEYVEKTRNLLNDIWKNTHPLSAATLDPETWSNKQFDNSSQENVHTKVLKKMYGTSITNERLTSSTKLNKEDAIIELINSQKAHVMNETKTVVKTYGTNAQAIVHPPKFLNLPKMLFHIYHMEKQSTFGTEDAILIHLWLNTTVGYSYVPVALITDNPEAASFWQGACAGTPASNNVSVVRKNELQIQLKSNILFAGWTVPISLPQSSIPPSGLLIEGYGETKSTAYSIVIPSGYKMKIQQNICDAFVLYLNPVSNYSGPGTDGCISKEVTIEYHTQPTPIA
jgi:sugar-specific transcriptional regulator TrmB